MQILWAFRYNPLRGGSLRTCNSGGRNFGPKLRGLSPSTKRSVVHVSITTGCRPTG
ncbi:MAG: hypothetical protein LBK44_01420 [Spirochaetales bacterium]|nr:hypothetical protein [Spirochaetales bacterium]